MSSPPEPTEPDPSVPTVEVRPGLRIPQRFVQSFLTERAEEEEGFAHTTVTVVMTDSGESRLEAFEFRIRGGLPASELRRPDLAGCLRWAVTQEIARALMLEQMEREGVSVGEFDDEAERVVFNEARKLSSRRKPTRVTDELLEEVVGFRRKGGDVGSIAEHFGASPRTVLRWLAEAKDRGID